MRARRTHLEKTREGAAEKPVDPVHSFSVEFAAEASRADIALKAQNISCGFPGRTLFADASLLVRTGERVALVGPNGCGKTTLIREMLRRASGGDRSVMIGPSLTPAYCSQHAETLDPVKKISDVFFEAGAKTVDEAWKTLSRFLFARESLEQRVGSLSGGELNRLQLALAMFKKADFLILDEPTNHLDIAACEAVEDALADYAGTIFAVSHDRYFLDRIATSVLEIDEGRIVRWDGNSRSSGCPYGTGIHHAAVKTRRVGLLQEKLRQENRPPAPRPAEGIKRTPQALRSNGGSSLWRRNGKNSNPRWKTRTVRAILKRPVLSALSSPAPRGTSNASTANGRSASDAFRLS